LLETEQSEVLLTISYHTRILIDYSYEVFFELYYLHMKKANGVKQKREASAQHLFLKYHLIILIKI
jgi:hypothetical protein